MGITYVINKELKISEQTKLVELDKIFMTWQRCSTNLKYFSDKIYSSTMYYHLIEAIKYLYSFEGYKFSIKEALYNFLVSALKHKNPISYYFLYQLIVLNPVINNKRILDHIREENIFYEFEESKCRLRKETIDFVNKFIKMLLNPVTKTKLKVQNVENLQSAQIVQNTSINVSLNNSDQESIFPDELENENNSFIIESSLQIFKDVGLYFLMCSVAFLNPEYFFQGTNYHSIDPIYTLRSVFYFNIFGDVNYLIEYFMRIKENTNIYVDLVSDSKEVDFVETIVLCKLNSLFSNISEVLENILLPYIVSINPEYEYKKNQKYSLILDKLLILSNNTNDITIYYIHEVSITYCLGFLAFLSFNPNNICHHIYKLNANESLNYYTFLDHANTIHNLTTQSYFLTNVLKNKQLYENEFYDGMPIEEIGFTKRFISNKAHLMFFNKSYDKCVDIAKDGCNFHNNICYRIYFFSFFVNLHISIKDPTLVLEEIKDNYKSLLECIIMDIITGNSGSLVEYKIFKDFLIKYIGIDITNTEFDISFEMDFLSDFHINYKSESIFRIFNNYHVIDTLVTANFKFFNVIYHYDYFKYLFHKFVDKNIEKNEIFKNFKVTNTFTRLTNGKFPVLELLDKDLNQLKYQYELDKNENNSKGLMNTFDSNYDCEQIYEDSNIKSSTNMHIDVDKNIDNMNDNISNNLIIDKESHSNNEEIVKENNSNNCNKYLNSVNLISENETNSKKKIIEDQNTNSDKSKVDLNSFEFLKNNNHYKMSNLKTKDFIKDNIINSRDFKIFLEKTKHIKKNEDSNENSYPFISSNEFIFYFKKEYKQILKKIFSIMNNYNAENSTQNKSILEVTKNEESIFNDLMELLDEYEIVEKRLYSLFVDFNEHWIYFARFVYYYISSLTKKLLSYLLSILQFSFKEIINSEFYNDKESSSVRKNIIDVNSGDLEMLIFLIDKFDSTIKLNLKTEIDLTYKIYSDEERNMINSQSFLYRLAGSYYESNDLENAYKFYFLSSDQVLSSLNGYTFFSFKRGIKSRFIIENHKNDLIPKENILMKESLLKLKNEENEKCCICYEENIETLYLPCKHAISCIQCSIKIYQSSFKCPICKKILDYFI